VVATTIRKGKFGSFDRKRNAAISKRVTPPNTYTSIVFLEGDSVNMLTACLPSSNSLRKPGILPPIAIDERSAPRLTTFASVEELLEEDDTPIRFPFKSRLFLVKKPQTKVVKYDFSTWQVRHLTLQVDAAD
jgi:hypothetical protein